MHVARSVFVDAGNSDVSEDLIGYGTTLKCSADTVGGREIRITCQSQMRLIRVESSSVEWLREIRLES